MTADAKRLALLDAALAELVVTKQGYVDLPRGQHWKDAMASLQKLRKSLLPTPATMCFPLPANAGGSVCQGLHETAGIPGNWAIDFCDSAGVPVLAPEAGAIWRLSGNDPSQAKPNPNGVYGWSIYIKTAKGYVYYVTHLGQRMSFAIGHKVALGTELGKIGNQQPLTGRPNHTHIGVTSPLGETDAKKHITAVSTSGRLAL